VKKLYLAGREFLIEKIPSADAQVILDSYLGLPASHHEIVDLSELFRRLLSSAQNSNMKAGVIGESVGGFNNLGKALFSFDPEKTSKNFDGAPD